MPYDPERITFFATTDARGKHVPFGIKAKDRTRHVYVIGKTGMGKSTLLENMAVQDIRNGEGLAFIDPHGQTAEKLLHYIPEERKQDVLYFAPFDTDNPVSFNVMEDVGPDKRHLVVSGLMSVFKKIFVDAWSARMEYILSNTLLALLEYPDSTLLGVNRMLSDKAYRKKVVENVKDPAVKSFWVDEFANYNERYMQEAGDAIKNKIGQFTANPLIRNIIGQPKSSFDIRKIMDERKILIMNLSKGLVGETNANLLGSMLTTRIYLAAMSRADLPIAQMEKMPNFYFYVDEFQSFANATFANILSEARKYKLNLTIAHQYIEQMEEDVRNAVFGNVGTTIVFRVGPFDAEVLETIFSPRFLAADIVNLGFAQIYLTLMIDGIGSAPFSAVTLPPLETEPVSYRDVVVAESRRQFASNRTAVEAAINAWHEDGRALPEPRAPRLEAGKRKDGGSQGSGNKRRDDAPREERKEVNRERKTDDNQHTSREERRPSRESVPPRPPERERRESEGERRKPVAHKKLDDLRSVLASISKSDEKIPAQAEGPKQEDTKAQNEKPEAGDLKNALAAVLKQNEAVTAPKAAVPQSAPKESTEEASAAGEEREKGSELDPKKLERMMRVTTSDKTPLK